MDTKTVLTHSPPAPDVEFHADDYGLFPAQSARILRCRSEGCLNGISILPNSDYLAQSMALAEPYREGLHMAVHLNLIEGRSVCPREDVPALVDAQGNLNCRFGSLLLRSFLPGRAALRAQLRRELAAQIDAVRALLPPDAPVRLDSHAHYHMIPVVFDAMMDVVRERELPVQYIRIPREHLRVYRFPLCKFPPINLVKVGILNLLSVRSAVRYGAYLKTLERRVFLGVLLSGRMTRQNVQRHLQRACRLAAKKGMGLELLAHPGGVYEEADIARLTNADDLAFLTSPNREREQSLYQILNIEEIGV